MRKLLLAAVALTLALAPGTAARASGLVATLSANVAKPGETVRVSGEGWTPGKLLQFVTCGEGGLTGSAACDTRSGLATPVRADGKFVVDLQIGTPPKDCPCVVHIAEVQGTTDPVNLPISITGLAVGTIPKTATAVRELAVQEVRLTGGTAAAWFGARDQLQLTYTVRNPTAVGLNSATVQVRLGGGGDDNIFHQEVVENLAPGQSRTFTVPVELPLAAFGKYVVSADVSGLAPIRVSHNAYPWGLILINAVGISLIVWGLLRRYGRRRALRDLNPADAMLPAVVRLGSLGAYLVFDDAPGSRRLRRHAGAQLSLDNLRTLIGQGNGPGAGDSVLDLDALGHVLARRYPRSISLMEEER
ncbi:hypothetical protein FB565_004148 [Actinoplanes lutulentus]|uniref:CARDB protein n=1 Tax=Actinoplanes lutulentus TaxID=1287878 RepID=A0A327ZI30_9ACTN|nr:hypothetical protein [Actinoplanes lutulentus]MBB2944419.1 hypothetical protein [Actinoplanes lutulentus]RAK42349.1 hypothetical protein B0I29_102174 [Actinoplanes lutulentus]